MNILLYVVLLATPTNPVPKGKIGLEAPVSINGIYACKGSENPGKHYTGVTLIEQKGDVYVVQWMLRGSPSQAGIGIRTGNMLSVSWAVTNQKGTLVKGVNVYQIHPGPMLSGRWTTIPGDGMLKSETLTFVKDL